MKMLKKRIEINVIASPKAPHLTIREVAPEKRKGTLKHSGSALIPKSAAIQS
jgi:hypothetical protein